MDIYLYTAAVFLFGGIVQGLSGFGTGLVAIPLLSMSLGLAEAVPLVILVSPFITVPMAWHLRGHVRKGRIMPLIVGCLPGIAVGTFLLAWLPDDPMKIAMGIGLVVYSLYGLFLEKPRTVAIGEGWGYVAGFFTGAIAAAFSTGGPPAVVYMAMTGWSKDSIKATLAVFFTATCGGIIIGHALSGLITWHVLLLTAICVPSVLIGTRIGLAASARLGERSYRTVLFTMLMLMGVMMCRDALRSFQIL